MSNIPKAVHLSELHLIARGQWVDIIMTNCAQLSDDNIRLAEGRVGVFGSAEPLSVASWPISPLRVP